MTSWPAWSARTVSRSWTTRYESPDPSLHDAFPQTEPTNAPRGRPDPGRAGWNPEHQDGGSQVACALGDRSGGHPGPVLGEDLGRGEAASRRGAGRAPGAHPSDSVLS